MFWQLPQGRKHGPTPFAGTRISTVPPGPITWEITVATTSEGKVASGWVWQFF